MKNNEYVAPRCEYNLVNDRKIYKVKEPYYSEKDRIIYASCPYCGGQLHRVWNLNNCGNCGAEISWSGLSVAGYHDLR